MPHDGRLRRRAAGAAGRRDASSRCTRRPASTRGSSTRSRCSTRSPPRSRRRPSSTATCCAGPSGTASPTSRSAQLRGMPEDVVRGVRHALGIRPVYKTVDTCAAEFAATTPYHYSSYDEETEVAPRDEPAVHHPRQRAEPDRPGHRVRLLLRARVVRAARRRLRDRDGQLQPRDRLDRLRHLRPALLRAAHPRGRARGRARRAAGRPGRSASSCSSAGRPRSAWRSGSRTPACRSSAPAPRRSTSPRTAARSAGCSPRPGCPRPSTAPRRRYDGARRIAAEIGYPVLVRPSYVLGGRGMEIVYDEEQLADLHGRGDRDLGRAPGAGRPVPRRRDRDRRRRALRRRGALPRRRDGAHRGGRHPLRRLGLRAAAGHARPARRSTGSATSTEAIARGVGVRGLLNVQFALAADVLYVLEANPRASRTVPFVSKATGVPLAKAAARVMLGATHRRAARRGPAARRPATAATLPVDAPVVGQGGGAAVQAVPHRRGPRRRPRARPGDALDRRGDGHRRDVRHRVRQVAGGGVRRAADQGRGRSSRWPTATSAP